MSLEILKENKTGYHAIKFRGSNANVAIFRYISTNILNAFVIGIKCPTSCIKKAKFDCEALHRSVQGGEFEVLATRVNEVRELLLKSFSPHPDWPKTFSKYTFFQNSEENAEKIVVEYIEGINNRC